MRATIDDLVCPDVDPESGQPSDPFDFEVMVEVFVATRPDGAPDGIDGVDLFTLFVVTPARLARRVAAEGPAFGRHRLIVDRWDWDVIAAALTERFESEEAPTHEELMQRLGRYGRWEFEDDGEHDTAVASEDELGMLRALGIDVGDEPPRARG